MNDIPLPDNPVGWALFLDIDGTLLDLAATPDGVVVPPGLGPLLASLEQRLDGALALISGRSLSEIDRLFPGLGHAAGNHGAEIRALRTPFRPEPAWPHVLAAALARDLDAMTGVRVERKTMGLALHYRGGDELRQTILGLARRAAERTGEQRLRILEGKAVVELIPEDAGKGEAIEMFMAQPPFRGRTPIFIGDDLTDEEGFDAVGRIGGIAVHVGRQAATRAAFRLPDPGAVRSWLERANTSLKGGRQ